MFVNLENTFSMDENFKRGVSGHKSQLIKKKSKSQFQGDQPVNRKKPFVYDC